MALSGLLIITAMGSIAFAGQIQPTVNVNGTLNGVCRAGVSGSLSFSIDPALAGPLSATVTDATVFCSNGTAFTVTAESTNKGGGPASCASGGGGITGTLKDASNNPMDYTFTCGVDGTAGNTGTGKGHGAGKDVPLGLAGSIAAVSYQNAPVGNYSDTVTLTITY
jgi:spore coat protein U-like protein